MTADTIVAVSTALGEAAISVLRLSGPQAVAIAAQVMQTGKPVHELPPREAHLARIMDREGALLDQGLLLVFRAPASYTGEDVVEFHGHGGVLVTQRVLERFLEAGARAAEAGEFTQRAFVNSKMDLTQAEAVMDLIHAQSSLALRAANEQLDGGIGQQAESLRSDLIEVLAHIEAYIDFPEEGISPETGQQLQQRLQSMQTRVAQLIDTADQGRILRHGARTVLSGAPNVGKSSLLNVLLGFERAIVSTTAGTTRDTIEEIIQVHGIPLRLVDTAGLRESQDEIEKVGMDRTHHELERADLILEIVDASLPPHEKDRVPVPESARGRHLLVLNKTDLATDPGWNELAHPSSQVVPISCASGQGIDTLREAIRTVIGTAGALSSDHPIAINARHKACFQKVQTHLEAGTTALQEDREPEFIALDLRDALQSLGDVIGATDVEQILDVVFSSFCIGK